MINKIRITAILILLQCHPSTAAATLKPETKTAWDAYLQAANAAMQARLQPGAHFLWLEDEPDRADSIRTKGPYIAPVGRHIPKRVPSGTYPRLAWGGLHPQCENRRHLLYSAGL
ncbi:MAG: hypothetical protein ACJ74Z_22320 [Bryobacteraceae bacterium]